MENMAARYLSTTAFPCTSQRKFATLLISCLDTDHRDEFSDAPQGVRDDYPEYAGPTQKPISTQREWTGLEAASTSPQRRLGDMNPLIFWLVIAVAAVVIIAASVGGAVGGAAAVRKSQSKTASPVIR